MIQCTAVLILLTCVPCSSCFVQESAEIVNAVQLWKTERNLKGMPEYLQEVYGWHIKILHEVSALVLQSL